MMPLLRMTLRYQRRAWMAWAIGLIVVATLYTAFFPSIRDSAAEFQGYIEKLPDAARRLHVFKT